MPARIGNLSSADSALDPGLRAYLFPHTLHFFHSLIRLLLHQLLENFGTAVPNVGDIDVSGLLTVFLPR